MQRNAAAPSRADGEALPDQNDPGVTTNCSPATVNVGTATFGGATQDSVEFPESLLLERSAERTEEA